MEKKVKVIEVRTSEGQVIFSFHIFDKEIASEGKPPNRSNTSSAGETQQGKEKKPNNGSGNGDSMMSDAQKRYLFRILAEQGIAGEEARQHLLNLLGVCSLKDVTKQEASQLIEHLLKEQKEGARQ